MNCLSVFDRFVGLALKGLMNALNDEKCLLFHLKSFFRSQDI